MEKKLPVFVRAFFPIPAGFLVLAVLLPGFRSFALLIGAAFWVWKERKLRAAESAVSAADQILQSLDALNKSSTFRSADRKVVEGFLSQGRGETVSDEWFTAQDKYAYDVLEARFQKLGGDPEALSNRDWGELASIYRYFAVADDIHLQDMFLRDVRNPDEIAAHRQAFDAIKAGESDHTAHPRVIFTSEADAPDIRAFAGPDIHLWHWLATDSHEFHAWEESIWWILEQPACDRATVSEFLIMFVFYELLEDAARRNDVKRIGRFRTVIDRWNSGFYVEQSLGPLPGHIKPGCQYDSFAADIARIEKEYGVELPRLPQGIFEPMKAQPERQSRHVPSGWVYAWAEGLWQA